ncbi:metallophosphoesterase family protein [Balneolales bacterium ANBcel1]|nr:metallophosphoesterase family protein [Balneolales bacterium ANBcel1]
MRLAILSDIHANLPALEACLRKLDQLEYDRVISLGDQVGYGPYPNEVISLLREREIPTVLGNHDAGAVERIPLTMFREPNHSLLTWTRDHLTPENRAWLAEAPWTLEGDDWIASHASPVDPQHWTYLDSAPRCREVLSRIPHRYCLVGHTHIPAVVAEQIGVFRVKTGHRYVINPGSVGQPRDYSRTSSFGILDTGNHTWESYQATWPEEVALEGFAKTGLDEATGRRLLML